MMVLTRRRFIQTVSNTLLVAALGSGCSKKDNRALTVQLPWTINAEAAGLFVALEDGLYRAAGLDVKLNPGGPNADPVQLVATGSATIGIVDGAKLILARLKGVPIRAFAVEFQESPFCYTTLASSGITSVAQFCGKKIGTQLFQQFVLEIMLGANGMSLSDVRVVPVQFDVRPLIEGQVDAFLSFITGEPVLLEMQGIATNVIRASDNGFRFYSNAMFATDETLQRDEDVLVAFLRATRDGWMKAFADPAHAIEVVLKYNPAENREYQLRTLELLKPLALGTDGRIVFGTMESERWSQSIQSLAAVSLIQQSIDPTSLFTEAVLGRVRGS